MDATATPTTPAAADPVADPAPADGPAYRPLLGIAAALFVVLVATSSRYGYHRDELYFLTAGRHLAWGYPDQPSLTPLIARAMNAIGPGSLTLLRLPSALASAVAVVAAGLISYELGGGRRAQIIAAAVAAVSVVTVVIGHFVTTTTFDVCFSAMLCWLVARLIRTGQHRLWLPAGLVLGIGLLNKDLVGILAVALVAALALVGPRDVLRSRWLVAGGLVALAGGLPYLIWQAAHGWPQVAMARHIAGGSAEGGRPGFIPFQLLLISPVLVPVWVAGLIWLWRAPAARRYRAFALLYVLLAVAYIVTGGKAYYLSGAYPVLLGAGAIATDGWLRRAATPLRSGLLAAAVALSAAVCAVIGLAVVPASALNGPILGVNPDAGEQVGWPEFAATVADVYHRLPAADRAGAVILAENYGEAGALDRYGPADGLPPVYSGHNGFANWGIPPGSAGPTVVVGYRIDELSGYFGRCQQAATIDNAAGVHNQERGGPVLVCRGPRRPWSAIWPELRHLG